MQTLNDRIKLAQAAAIDRENKITEEVLRENELQLKRCQEAATFVLANLQLEVEPDYFDCTEHTHTSDADNKPYGRYTMAIHIGEKFSDYRLRYQEDDNHHCRVVGIRFEIVYSQTVPVTPILSYSRTNQSRNPILPFWAYNLSGSSRDFDNFDEALAFATEGYEETKPESVINLERLVTLFHELCDKAAADYPELSIQFSLHQADAGIIQAAQNLEFQKSFFGKGKGGSWKIYDETLGHSHSLVIFDDSITE